jgi:hypothetical protein
MKKLLLVTLYSLITIVLFAQQPTNYNGFKWQAVLREGGRLVKTGTFTVQAVILQDASGNGDWATIYQEDHANIKISSYGQIEVNIGSGQPNPNFMSFENIPWGEKKHDLQISFIGLGNDEIIEFDQSPILIPAFWAGRSLWKLSGDSLLQSGQRNVDIQGNLDLQGHFNWHSGKNFLLKGSLNYEESEFSLDFPDGDGKKRWSIWDPEHQHILVARNNGRVGVGTIQPAQELHVFQDNGTNADIRLQTPGEGYLDLYYGPQNAGIWLKAEKPLRIGTNNQERIRITEHGDIGMGTNDPLQRLHVRESNAYAQIRLERTGNNAGHSTIGGSKNGFYVGHFDDNNNYHVDFVADHNGKAIVNVLEIKGGSDIKEDLNSTEELEPGDVVVLDEQHPGNIRRTNQEYDKKVAGVISGANGVNPGLSLSQEDVLDGDYPLTMLGRVYVKVTGKVEIGDMLTTSSKCGYAMSVTDFSKAHGTVIGKAMTGNEEGEGMVLVLVNLQ